MDNFACFCLMGINTTDKQRIYYVCKNSYNTKKKLLKFIARYGWRNKL